MKAIFYDKKNKCEVSSEQLMSINLVVDLIATDRKDDNPSDRGFHTMQLGKLGWKSDACSKGQNWDMFLMSSDLIFLRLE